jgi:Phage integrase, N-terminal SAM-like domain
MSTTDTVSPLRQRMIEDMAARKLNPHTQRSHIQSCKRFAAWLKRSPDTATPDEVRRFQRCGRRGGATTGVRHRQHADDHPRRAVEGRGASPVPPTMKAPNST